MDLVGKVEIRTVELPDSLEFTASREEGLVEKFAIPAFTLMVLCWFWSSGNLWLRVIAGVAAATTVAALIANRVQGSETRLRITSDEVVAEGNLGRFFSTRERIAVSDVSSIRYDDGGDGGISGLYARQRWRSTLLLPWLTVDQTNVTIDVIRRKFPHIPAERHSPFSISDLPIFDHRDEITTLGLSDSDENKTNRTES